MSQMQVDSAITHLSVWLREEIVFQTERLEALVELCAALALPNPYPCESILLRIQEQETVGRSREIRRSALMARMAELWDLGPSEVNLRTIAVRAGENETKLLEMRKELKSVLHEVGLEAVRVSASARVHRSVILEVLNALFDQGPGDPLEEQGHLLDAEA